MGLLEWKCENCGEWKRRAGGFLSSGLNNIAHPCKFCRGEAAPRPVKNNSEGRTVYADHVAKLKEADTELENLTLDYRMQRKLLKDKKSKIYDDYTHDYPRRPPRLSGLAVGCSPA